MPQNTGSGLSRGAVSDLLKAQAELAAANANLKAVESQLDDANLAIAVLVNMLGGSVTISSSEVENANKFDLTATRLAALQDVLVLSVREK
jgi:outer membrane protein TolC